MTGRKACSGDRNPMTIATEPRRSVVENAETSCRVTMIAPVLRLGM